MVTAAPPASRDLHGKILRRVRRRRLFHRMMSRQGIDFARGWWHGSEEMIVRALRACSLCPRPETCRSWLDQDHPAENHPGFCLNRTVIEVCRIMDPGATPLASDAPDRAPDGEPSLAEIRDDPIIKQLIEADRMDGDRRQRRAAKRSRTGNRGE
jgi:hypothetical protein